MSICKQTVKRFCKEFENIENYQEAISSPEMWDCHHRNEIDMNLSRQELIDSGLYWHRPPEELIFMPRKEHLRLHKIGNKQGIGNKSRLGQPHSEETKKKISESNKGKNPHTRFICPIKLTYMYCKQEMSAKEIAKEFNICTAVILRRLRELNIPIRKR